LLFPADIYFMQPKHSQHSHIAQRSAIAFFFSIWGTVLLIAALFSQPFPHVRSIWTKEVWGLLGLINSFLFIVFARRIENRSVTASLAILGILINDQILSFRGFYQLALQNAVHLEDVLFLIFSVLATVILSLCAARVTQINLSVTHIHSESSSDSVFAPLVMSAIAYAVIIGFLVGSSFIYEDEYRFALFRMLGEAVSVVAMAGIGFEIKNYRKNRQSQTLCIVKACTHLLVLVTLLWILYRLIPIQEVILTNKLL
jgi:predicted permease